jgi:uncharacterized protein with HEPN domain
MVESKLTSSIYKQLLDVIKTIQDHIHGMNEDQFKASELHIQAVSMLLIHLAELISALWKIDPSINLLHHELFRSFRHMLAHQYLTIRKGLITQMIFKRMPELRQDIESKLVHQ